MYIIKQKDNLNTRFVQDCDENWTYEAEKAKVWASKALADAYVKFRGYKKCTLEELTSPYNKGASYKQTKCWKCKNTAKCEWAKGKPVPNWDAVPTTIRERHRDNIVLVDSYLVLDCPKFQMLDKETKKETKAEMLQRLAQEKGVSTRTIRRRLQNIKEKSNVND